MSSVLSAGDREFLEGRNYAHLATLRPDGSPHVTPLWVDVDDDLILVNTAEGRAKLRHARRDPRVALSVQAREEPSRALVVLGTVVEITGQGADEHIDAMSRRYDGVPWERIPGQKRVLLKIRPDHVTRQGP